MVLLLACQSNCFPVQCKLLCLHCVPYVCGATYYTHREKQRMGIRRKKERRRRSATHALSFARCTLHPSGLRIHACINNLSHRERERDRASRISPGKKRENRADEEAAKKKKMRATTTMRMMMRKRKKTMVNEKETFFLPCGRAYEGERERVSLSIFSLSFSPFHSLSVCLSSSSSCVFDEEEERAK